MLGPWTDIPAPDICTRWPSLMSDNAVCLLMCCAAQGMKEVLGPWTDIPAPDIGTDERVMAWIFDEFSKHKGFSPAVTTGKVCIGCIAVGSTWLVTSTLGGCEGGLVASIRASAQQSQQARCA